MSPHHVAIIMDGNRRWAKKRRLDVLKGHSQGSNNLKDIARHARELKIDYLTVFAFSTENWRRPQREVTALIELMRRFLMQDLEEMIRDNVKLRILGDITAFEPDLQNMFNDAVARTSSNTGLNLSVAINYGGKQDIVAAMQSIMANEKDGALISEETVKSHLHTSDLPAIDLLIRTGGEYRISNFILWDAAYAELHFSEKFWPDFGKADLDAALEDFKGRQRRYGGDAIAEKISKEA